MNGTHRTSTEAIPGTHEMVKHAAAMVAVLAAGFILAAAVLAFFAAFAPKGAPTVPASAWQTVTASMLAHDATQARPYWDGRHPRIWTANHTAMCSPRFSHRHGWARGDVNQPVFPVECLPDGAGFWTWEPISN